MKLLYQCEKCYKGFNTEEECLDHERKCDFVEQIPIKRIIISWMDPQIDNYIIVINEYSKARHFAYDSRFCYLTEDSDELQQIDFDEIYMCNGHLVIDTTDFSQENEERCIELLKTAERQRVEDDINCSKKQLKILIKKIKIERNIVE